MGKLQIVHLWLEIDCAENAKKVRAEFATFWTADIALAWWTLTFPGTADQQLALDLDALILKSFRDRIAQDCKVAPTDIAIVEAVAKAGWTSGGGGLHEGFGPVGIATTSGQKKTWTLSVGGETGTVCAGAQCVEVGK